MVPCRLRVRPIRSLVVCSWYFIISVFDTTISDVRHSGLCHSDDRSGKEFSCKREQREKTFSLCRVPQKISSAESPCHSERSEESPPIFVISSVIPGKCEESLCHSGAIQVKIGGSGNEIFSSSQKSRKESSDDNVYTVLLLVRYTRKAVRRKKLGFPSMKTRTSFPASSSCLNRS